ncbi:MAG: metal ABC transporter permease [Candidatus Rokuibacteriota bacterium]
MLDVVGQPFFQHALVAGTLVGLMGSLVGVYVLLKRMVFLGIALAQLASAGVGLALLVGWPLLPTALAASLGGAVAFSHVHWRRGIPMDALVGLGYVMAAALGIVFVAKNPVGEARALQVLFGNILSVPTGELAALAVVAAVVTLVHIVFRKEFVFVAFDYETAAAQGVRARLWHLLLYLTLGVAIAFAIRSAGVLVTFALLVVPALAARLMVAHLRALFWTAIALGTLGVPLGVLVAFVLDLPTGAAISLTLVLLAGVALVVQRTVRLIRPLAALGLVLLGLVSTAGAQTPPAAPPPPPVPSAPTAPGSGRESLPERPASTPLPPYLALLPEVRVEGNIIGNYTFGNYRRLERQLGEEQEGEEFFVRRNRLNVREVELGLRSTIDPFARFEAIISAEQVFEGEFEVGLEEAILTFGALPGRIELKVGKFRTTFGEFNDSDPEEFPEVDPPNVISNVFGRDGDGWIDTGLTVSRLFGLTEQITLLLTAGVFNGDNETAFHGGEAGAARKPAWFGRAETFFEIGEAIGLELGAGFASGYALDEDDRPTLQSRIFTAHVELDYRDPVLGLYRGANFLTEFFHTWRDQEKPGGEGEMLPRWGLYALAEAQLAREWSIAGRFDYSQLPTLAEEDDAPRVRHETAGSLIVSYRPSRFLTLRMQYKHTARNFAADSDEIFMQALFKIGYERPGPF